MEKRVRLGVVKPGPGVYIALGGANIQIVYYFEEEKSMIHSFTVTFIEQNILLVWSLVFLPMKRSVLLK